MNGQSITRLTHFLENHILKAVYFRSKVTKTRMRHILKCMHIFKLYLLLLCACFNSIQDYLYSTFYDTIVAKQLCGKLSFYNRFINCRNLTYLTYGKMWLILYTV